MLKPDETVGWYSNRWWRETRKMVIRGAEEYWKRRGLPEPEWQFWPTTYYDNEVFESIEPREDE